MSLRRILYACGVAAIAGNFLWFAWGSLGAHFAPDEMMNMGWAWDAGPMKLLTQLVAIWEASYRPTGALYYWAFHALFHLNPLPFRAFDLALVACNIWLCFALARALGAARPVAFVATFLFSYHDAVMIWVIYNGAWAYDRLCFTFTLATLLVYVRWREHGWGRVAMVVLFLLALGAKEMAVVIPALLIVYEAVQWRTISRPTRAGLAFLAALCAMSLLYAYGRTHGAEALSNKTGYKMKPATAGNYLDAQGRHLKDYFFREEPLSRGQAAAVLGAMLALVALTRSRPLGFAWAFVLIAPVPIAFVDRGGGALYIPLWGWCLFAAEGLWAIWPGRWPRARNVGFALTAAALAFTLNLTNRYYFQFSQPAMLANGDDTWRIIRELDRIRPDIRPGADIYVEKDPLENWDMWFLLALWADVKPIEIRLAGKNAPLGAATPSLTGIVSLDAQQHLTYRAVTPRRAGAAPAGER